MPKRRTDTASKRVRKTVKGVATAAAPAAGTKVNGTAPGKPASLEGRAAAIWDEFAPALMLQGMLTCRDTLTFALWCRLGEKVEAGELTGALITQFRLLANDFGLTPSGKGRELGPVPPPDPGAKRSKFFND